MGKGRLGTAYGVAYNIPRWGMGQGLMGLEAIYDGIATGYNARHKETIHFVEEQIILEQVRKFGHLGRVLSLGCGTGHDITMCHLGSKGFLGVDVSRGMLDVARKNYPDYEFARRDARETSGIEADTVIGLFGILNYLGPETIRDILHGVSARKFFFVCYAPPYFPDYINGEAKHYGPEVIDGALGEDFKVSIAGLSYPILGMEKMDFAELYESQKFLMRDGTLGQCNYWMVSGTYEA
jgi:SAM-dependent methyltransferase